MCICILVYPRPLCTLCTLRLFPLQMFIYILVYPRPLCTFCILRHLRAANVHLHLGVPWSLMSLMNLCRCTSALGRDLADKIQLAANPLLSGEYEINKDKAKFHFKTIEINDIRDAFAKVKTTKSFGIDMISSYFMKLALPYIENSLAFLFNTSIETSQFPDSWKVARITQILNNGHRTEKSIYRPISVLPVISQSSLKNLFSTSCTCI